MKGEEWKKAFKNKSMNELNRIKDALETLEADPDIYREFKESGLFWGLGNLKMFAEEELQRRDKIKVTDERKHDNVLEHKHSDYDVWHAAVKRHFPNNQME